ncbi:MAG: hypothetical protein M3O03_00930 [Pseudomonadota bacterium]|nr:hypothetical protein [Pseudomonadota bacterium]
MENQPQNLYRSEEAVPFESGSYIDWSAIIGGIALASATSIVMLAFGSAIGLSFSNVTATTKGYAIGAGIAAAIWFIWVQVSSFMVGSYLTGRMRKRKYNSTEHEVEVRDGSHGLLVWAGSVLIGSFLALSGVSSVVNSIGSIAKTATETTATIAGGSPSASMQYYTDVLLRGPSTATASSPKSDRVVVANEINTILARSALTAPTPDDKTYLAQIISQQTGVTADIAKTRVDEAYASIDNAKANVAKAAESARRIGVIAAFLLAASMLISAAASFWAATLGGNHRDQSVVFNGFFRRV